VPNASLSSYELKERKLRGSNDQTGINRVLYSEWLERKRIQIRMQVENFNERERMFIDLNAPKHEEPPTILERRNRERNIAKALADPMIAELIRKHQRGEI